MAVTRFKSLLSVLAAFLLAAHGVTFLREYFSHTLAKVALNKSSAKLTDAKVAEDLPELLAAVITVNPADLVSVAVGLLALAIGVWLLSGARAIPEQPWLCWRLARPPPAEGNRPGSIRFFNKRNFLAARWQRLVTAQFGDCSNVRQGKILETWASLCGALASVSRSKMAGGAGRDPVCSGGLCPV